MGVWAQVPPTGGMNPSQMPKIGKISGMVTDAATGQPIPYATVALQRAGAAGLQAMRNGNQPLTEEQKARFEAMARDTSVVAGMVSDEKGRFLLENLPLGAFKLKVSFIGYRPFVKTNLVLMPNKAELDLGKIALQEITTTTNEVTVTAERDMVQIAPDRKVYNVGKDLTSTGGTGLDVMKNIPSVEVDMNNNVSLRGSSNIQVLVDGKPSNLPISTLLEQIPSTQIERIEVITNPSAKFDAESSAGILNIVLKRPSEAGYNATISSNQGTGFVDHSFKSMNNIALNYRAPKYNAFVNLGYNQMNMNIKGYTNRKTFTADTTFYANQTGGGYRQFGNVVVRTGFEYFLQPKTTLSATLGWNLRDGLGFEDNQYEYLNELQVLSSAYTRQTNSTNDNVNYEAALDFRKQFTGVGHEWTANASYQTGSQESSRAYSQFSDASKSDLSQERDMTTGPNNLLSLQTDYVRPLENGSKLELGLKATIRNNDQTFTVEDLQSGNWVKNTTRSNQFALNEQVYAAYATWTGQFSPKLSYQIGLRAVQTRLEGDQKTTDQSFTQNYFALFPSLSIRQNINQSQEVSASYSRRLNRGRFEFLNPFPDYSDPLTVRQGNPALRPEYVNSAELGYSRFLNMGSLTTTAYYRYTTGVVSPINRVNANGTNTVTFENLKNSTSYGLEVIGQLKMGKMGNLMTTFNGYKKEVSGIGAGAGVDATANEGYAWSVRINAMFNLNKQLSGQLMGNYDSPNPGPQGTMSGRSGFDAGLMYRVTDALSLNARVNDLFNQRGFKSSSSGENFTNVIKRQFDGRTVLVGVTWNVGKAPKQQAPNRAKKRAANEDGQVDGEF